MAAAFTLLRAASSPSLACGHAGRDGGSFHCPRLPPRKTAPCRKILCSLKYGCLGVDPAEAAGRTAASPVYSSLTVSPAGDAVVTSSEQKVYHVVLKQAALLRRQLRPQKQQQTTAAREQLADAMPRGGLKEAYARCGEICDEYAKTFYLGTLLMTEERRRAIWAIYVWCRRTDELVDGPNASHITPQALDRWEKRLEDLFAGRPYDMLDAALSDTITKFPIDIQDELAEAGLSDEDIFKGVVTDKWRKFMKRQIKRARTFFEEAERGVTELRKESRWPVWASLLLYRQILDEIEANDYNNFTKRAYVGKAKKVLALPVAYGRSLLLPYSLRNSQK